jgi:hypothetical protein
VGLGEFAERAAVADDSRDLDVEFAGIGGIQERFETVGFLGDTDGDPTGLPIAGEPYLDLDAEFPSEVRKRLPEFVGVGLHLTRLDAHRHPEQAITDRLIEILDVDSALEQQSGDSGDESGFVAADNRDFGEFGRHTDTSRPLSSAVITGR